MATKQETLAYIFARIAEANEDISKAEAEIETAKKYRAFWVAAAETVYGLPGNVSITIDGDGVPTET